MCSNCAADALEAALVPKGDFIQSRLTARAARLLGLDDEKTRKMKKLLNDFYGIRSTLVHGSPLSPEQLSILRNRDRWLAFELLVRDLIVAAIKAIPAEETARQAYLAGLGDVDDTVRADQLRQNFNAIKDAKVRRDLLAELNKS